MADDSKKEGSVGGTIFAGQPREFELKRRNIKIRHDKMKLVMMPNLMPCDEDSHESPNVV
jgi:hypothetical protein